MQERNQKHFILASSSSYRAKLLQTIIPFFKSYSPNINESVKPKENPIDLVKRLALEKALAVFDIDQFQNAFIIASDQIALFEDKIIGKPLTKEKAIEQLSLFSGNKIKFITSLCVYDTNTNKHVLSVEEYTVYFRDLTQLEIINYIDKENPLECAGSFKAEGLGITLFKKFAGNDFNSLIGLPLIKLNNILINDFSYNIINLPTS